MTTEQHLQLSVDKTILVPMKGNFRNRPPVVTLQGVNLSYKTTYKYLGVTFGAAFEVHHHLQALRERTMRVMGVLTRMAHSVWGLRSPAMRVYYFTLFLPMVAYAAGAWADKLNRRHERQILSLQRSIIRKATKAYATASTESLQVVMGALPLDLYLQMARRIYLYRRRGYRRFGHIDLTHHSRAEAGKAIKEEARRQWEQRWRDTQKAEVTHDFFPTIQQRLRRTWIGPTHAETQFYTGHGHFQHKLWTMDLANNPWCDCGDVDTPAHMIFQCGLYQDIREELAAAAREAGQEWPLPLNQLIDQPIYPAFQKAATDMMTRKQELWRGYNFLED